MAGTFDAASGTGDLQLASEGEHQVLYGFSCRESASTAAAAAFVLRHGRNDVDPPLAFVGLAADGSLQAWFGRDGPDCPDGVYLDRESGTTEVLVWVGPGRQQRMTL